MHCSFARRALLHVVWLGALLALPGCPDSIGVTCPPGQALCNGQCITVSDDVQNCGGCGKACPATLACINGMCGCPSGLTECSDSCVNTKADNTNCGACGTVCPAGQVCSTSACAVSCQAGLTNCGGSCVNLQSDAQNCNACGTACKTGETCTAGACVSACGSNLKLCGALCVDIKVDEKNCGACGTQCPADFECAAGICILGCPPPLLRCIPDGGASDGGTQCVDPSNDPKNCGGCGGADIPSPPPSMPAPPAPHRCIGTPGANSTGVCYQGTCAFICAAPFLDCDNGEQAQPLISLQAGEEVCEDHSTDPCNCGACGLVCSGWSGFCDDGGDEGPQAACCSNSCVDIFDPNSCGSCASTTKCGGSTPGCCRQDTETPQFACADFDNDLHNCGGCFNNCLDAQQPLCCGAVGQHRCTDGTTDANNCGACGTICPSPAPGATPGCCAPPPSPSPAVPGSGCVDFAHDKHNCGSCGNDCIVFCENSGATCAGGNCQCGGGP